MDLGDVLSKVWKIIWKNKILWIFGLLSSCGRGGGGGGGGSGNFNFPGTENFNLENGEDPFSNGDFPQLEEFAQSFESIFDNGDQTAIAFMIGIMCVVIILSVAVLFIQSIGRSGMIRGTAMADRSDEKLTFGQIWSDGSPYFVKVFLFNFLIGIVIFLAFMIVLIPLVLVGILTMGIGFICIIPLLCLMIPIGWAINVVIEQANVALVLENLGMVDAVKRGWNVCRQNLGPIAVMGLIIFVGGGIVSVIIALPLLLLIVPLVIGGVSQDQAVLTTGVATFGIMLCCLLPVIFALQGVLQSFIDTAWTLTFLRLTSPKAVEPDLQALPSMD